MLIKKEEIGKSRNRLNEYKMQLLSLSLDQQEIAVGLCLGDASLQKQSKNKEEYRLKFEWSHKHKDYVFHVYDQFSEWILSPPKLQGRFHPLTKNLIQTWRFQTISHIAFLPLAELFLPVFSAFGPSPEVPEGMENISTSTADTKLSTKRVFKKLIKPRLVLDHLTPKGLAYWYMDDGGLAFPNRFATSLNTHGFQFEEVKNLCEELSQKFELICWPKKNKGHHCIIISGHSYKHFKALIEPWIVPTMRYKIPPRL
jgi:hypothetical protein